MRVSRRRDQLAYGRVSDGLDEVMNEGSILMKIVVIIHVLLWFVFISIPILGIIICLLFALTMTILNLFQGVWTVGYISFMSIPISLVFGVAIKALVLMIPMIIYLHHVGKNI